MWENNSKPQMKFMMLFQWQFLYNNMRVYKRSMEYHEPLSLPIRNCVLFSNQSSLLGWVYNMWSFSTWSIHIYFILLFIFEVMQRIKDWSSATLLKVLVFCIPLISWNPWCMSLEIKISNCISLFSALQISSNVIFNSRPSNGYPILVALLL